MAKRTMRRGKEVKCNRPNWRLDKKTKEWEKVQK